MRTSILTLGLLLLLVTTAWSQPARREADIAQAVRDLGDPAFHVRQRAQETLTEAGWEIKAELEKAAKSPDPETAQNARAVLAKLIPGVTAKTSPYQRELVLAHLKSPRLTTGGNPLTRLAYQKPPPHFTLLALLEWERDRAQRKIMLRTIWSCVLPHFPELLAAGGTRTYESYIGWAIRLQLVDAVPQIAAYAYRDGKLDELRERIAGRAADDPTPFSRRLLVEISILTGRDDQAVAVAKTLDDWPFLEKLLVRTGQWGELARQMQSREPAPHGLSLTRLAAAQRLAGDEKSSAQTLARTMAHDADGNGVRLVEAAGETATAGRAMGLLQQQGLERQYVISAAGKTRAVLYVRHGPQSSYKEEASYCLLAFGFTGDAIQVLLNEGNWAAAAAVLSEQRRYGEAGRILQVAAARATPEDRWRWELRRAGILRSVGDPAGRRLVGAVLDQCLDGRLGTRTPELVHSVANEATRAGYSDLVGERMLELAVGVGEKDEKAVAGLLAAVEWRDGSFWWERLAELDPDMPPASRMRRLREFLAGRTPDAEAERILQAAIHPDDTPARRLSALLVIARVCARRGWLRRAEEAAQEARCLAEEANERWLPGYACYTALTLSGPTADWGKLAAAYRRMGQHGRPVLLVAAANFLAWQGDREAGRKLLDEALQKTLPGEWDKLLDGMTEGNWEGYRRILPIAAAQTDLIQADTLGAALEARDYRLVLRLAQRRWYGEVIPPPDYRRDLTVVMWMNAELALAESQCLIADGRLAAGLARARAGVAQCSDDTWRLISVRKQLAAAKIGDNGDVLAQWGLGFHRRVLDLFPDNVNSLHEFAWLSAWTGLEVEKAEKYIRRAIEQNPERSDLAEALAVLTYRRGETAQGIELMRKCVQMAPSFRHLNRLGRWLGKERK